MAREGVGPWLSVRSTWLPGSPRVNRGLWGDHALSGWLSITEMQGFLRGHGSWPLPIVVCPRTVVIFMSGIDIIYGMHALQSILHKTHGHLISC